MISPNAVFTSDGVERTVAWAGFSQKPFDARSACVAAVDLNRPDETEAARYRDLGAPTLFGCHGNQLLWFAHETGGTRLIDPIPAKDVRNFFAAHKDEFRPDRIYRAKTIAKFDLSHQLHFVDAGLMPLLEQNSGQWLGQKVEELVALIREAMTVEVSSKQNSRQVIQSVFWLLAARLLKDKDVKDFRAIDIADIDLAFERVAKHYGAVSTPSRAVATSKSLLAAAQRVKSFPSLVNVTTETLGYLHENTLVSPEIRKAFGTHSTPQWLVDYIVWQLTYWISKIEPDDRHVLEPGCGHAPFLVAALRVLQQSAPVELNDTARSKWLRRHVRGMEFDEFAREIGRLSLTIADVPNPNGWTLTPGDMFNGPELAHALRHSMIVLSNPPFEDFDRAYRDKANRQRKSDEIRINKAGELLWQIVQHLPANGVFGLVMPQGILSSANLRDVRERLTREFELNDICLLPDSVFGKADAESVVLLGRRRTPSPFHHVSARRVRLGDVDSFRTRMEPSSTTVVPQSSFLQNADVLMRVPDLLEVWAALHERPRLGDHVLVRQGFQFKNALVLAGREYIADKPRKGFVKAFLNADTDYDIFRAPPLKFVDYSKSNLRRPGADFASAIKQVIVSYAGPREKWCRKATIDEEGVAVSSRFLVFRPNDPEMLPLVVLWALLNSPLANAYADSHSTKRQTLPKEWRALPLPVLDAASIASITAAATAYRTAAKARSEEFFSPTSEAEVRDRLIQMDAAILKAYALPPGLEQRMLAIFDGVARPGVGCTFTGYPQVPETVTLPFHLRLLLPRFHELGDLLLVGTINRKQQAELKDIKERFDAYEMNSPQMQAFRQRMNEMDREHQSAMTELKQIEDRLRKQSGGGGE